MRYVVCLFIALWIAVAQAQPRAWETGSAVGKPTARQEAAFVAYKGKGYLIGGRRINPVDVYDLKTQAWLPPKQCPELPTLRAGNMAMAWGNEIIVGGGESATQKVAHDEVEAFHVESGLWQRWPSLKRGRHGSGFVVIGDYVYTASGSGNRGGGPELTSIERLKLPAVAVGEASVRQWHTKTLSFTGPDSSETADPNPFTDYRLLVTFKHPDVSYVIRGFYAADGNAAETGGDSGNVWRARFSPDRPGKWTYSASLVAGKDVAISDDPNAGKRIPLSDGRGSFMVEANPQSAPRGDLVDFRNRGRLIVDNGYLRFGTNGARWLKGGTNSPENLLAYEGFDGTRRLAVEASDGEATASESLHRYQRHVRDWNDGDPTWKDGEGKGLIGGINYLSSMGMNVAYFLTMNIGGDGKDVWPYVSPDEFSRFDCSKLDQWEIVFDHMQRRGMLLHVVTQETENERMLDDGDTGRLRKLYYRELIARFAHHPALLWNLGEENGPADFSPDGQTTAQRKAMASYLKQSDPYRHPVLIHTHATEEGKDDILPDLLGHQPLDGVSFQVAQPETVHHEVIRWRKKSKQAGHPWLISMDEIGMWHTGAVPDDVDSRRDDLRRHVLWGSLMAGAAGVEWYFGAKFPHNDLTSEDWRARESMWRQTKHALDFFESNLPYWEMEPTEDLASNPEAFCFAKPGEVYALYVPAGSLVNQDRLALNLGSNSGTFTVEWFDPVSGGALQEGTVKEVSSSQQADLGLPPGRPAHDGTPERDWVVLVKAKQ